MKTWDAKLYDGKHSFVYDYGLDLIDLLEPKENERILDLGCGTGKLTAEIAKRGASVVGLDSSSDMIEKAKSDFTNIGFVVGDGQDFKFPDKFDAVFSNAALHWMKEPQKVIACVWDVLKKGGRFVAEFGGRGNVETIIKCLSEVLEALKDPQRKLDQELINYFPSIGEYAALLEVQGFRVTHAFHFDRMTSLSGEDGLRNWIRMFRGFVLENLSPEEQDRLLYQVEERARPSLYKDGAWYADYKRLRIRAVRE